MQFLIDRVGYAFGKLTYWLEYPIDFRYEKAQLSLIAEEMRSLDLDHNLHEYFLGLGMKYFKGILNNMFRQSRTAAGLQEWLQQALPATTVPISVPQPEYQPAAMHLKHFTTEPPENPDRRIDLPASPDNLSDVSNPEIRAGGGYNEQIYVSSHQKCSDFHRY